MTETEIAIAQVTEIRESLPDYIRAGLERETAWYPYRAIVCHWMAIDRLTSGTKANRLALGREFKELRDIYSEKNIGGNRRTSGHGTFEKECEQRGYRPRTVRDWIADYEAVLAGRPVESAKRKERTQRKRSAQNPVAVFASLLPLEALQAAFHYAADFGASDQQLEDLKAAWEKVIDWHKKQVAVGEKALLPPSDAVVLEGRNSVEVMVN